MRTVILFLLGVFLTIETVVLLGGFTAPFPSGGRDSEMITELEVLNLLDETMTYARGDVPPPPDIYNINFQFVQGRLSVFRNAHNWVIAFEIVAYVPGACAYEHDLFLYGNCIQGQVQRIGRELPARIDVEELWNNQTGDFLARRDYVRIKWGDEWLEFTPTAQEYAAAGIVFPRDRQQANDLKPLELLAYLCWRLNSPFFLSEEELADAVQKAVVEGTDELRLVFQTREWQHPNFDERELPSQVPGMQVLARLIATGDASVWNEFRAEWVNTRFSHVVQVNWEFIYPPKPGPPPPGGPTYVLLPFVPEEWEEVAEEERE
jgi:hypothetical protein